MGLTYNGVTPTRVTYNGNTVKEVKYNGVSVWLARHMTAETLSLSAQQTLDRAIQPYGYVAVRFNGHNQSMAHAKVAAGAGWANMNYYEGTTPFPYTAALGYYNGSYVTDRVIYKSRTPPTTLIFWYRPDRCFMKVGDANGIPSGNWIDAGASTTANRLIIDWNPAGASVYICFADQAFGYDEIINAPAWARHP